MIEPKVFSVGQINRYIKNLLENDFILNSLLVQGEISNFKAHSSGHWYFTLKDAQGAIACVMFQQDAAQVPFLPENGFYTGMFPCTKGQGSISCTANFWSRSAWVPCSLPLSR